MLALFIETTNRNLLLGFVPESLGLLIFGAALIVSAVGLRRFFNRSEPVKSGGISANIRG